MIRRFAGVAITTFCVLQSAGGAVMANEQAPVALMNLIKSCEAFVVDGDQSAFSKIGVQGGETGSGWSVVVPSAGGKVQIDVVPPSPPSTFFPASMETSCTIFGYDNNGDTTLTWTDAEPTVREWAGGLRTDEDGSYMRGVCDAPDSSYIVTVGPTRPGDAGIMHSIGPAFFMYAFSANTTECKMLKRSSRMFSRGLGEIAHAR